MRVDPHGPPSVASRRPSGPGLVAAWVVFSSYCSCTGWVLSALHQLNRAGYTVAFLCGVAAIWLLRARLFPGDLQGWNRRKLQRRFGRGFPLAFLILASLAILGGALHPPSNYDAHAYRLPRML